MKVNLESRQNFSTGFGGWLVPFFREEKVKFKKKVPFFSKTSTFSGLLWTELFLKIQPNKGFLVFFEKTGTGKKSFFETKKGTFFDTFFRQKVPFYYFFVKNLDFEDLFPMQKWCCIWLIEYSLEIRVFLEFFYKKIGFFQSRFS